MGTFNYRHHARLALNRAEALLSSEVEGSFTYAALELRVAMECLAYERVLLYRSELPSEQLNIWQPRKIFDVLLELDPRADKTSSLAVAPESSLGVTSGPFEALGTDRVISNKEIKKYYDKLGSYLHAPTVGQADRGSMPTWDRIRQRCQEVADIIREALSSTIFAVDLKVTASMSCQKCGEQIVRRLMNSEEDTTARCPACSASYTIRHLEAKQVKWHPIQTELRCGNESCAVRTYLWRDDIKPGVHWTCEACGGSNHIVLGQRFTAKESGNSNEHQDMVSPGDAPGPE